MVVAFHAEVKPPQVGFNTDEYHQALAVSSSFERVDASVLMIISQVFSSASDRRAINGFQFLAHFLRLAQIMQLSLFPDCDVAVISIQSVWILCTNPSYAWPFSYEATSKYLRLLCAIGVFYKPKRRKCDQVAYHFPLRPYLFPRDVTSALSQLTTAHPKVSKSLALQRVLCRKTEPDKKSAKKRIADSSHPDLAQRIQIAAVTVRDRLQEKGISLPATALQEVAAAISQVFREDSRFFLGQHKEGQGSLGKLADSHRTESAIEPFSPEYTTCSDQQENQKESATFPQNRLSSQKKADSVAGRCTEFNSSSKNQIPLGIKDITEFNGSSQNESAKHENGQEKADFLSEESLLDADRLQHDASELSYLFEHNDSSIGHYTQLLRQDPRTLRLAVIDAWMRSLWPDKGYKRMKLGGAWVTKQYKAYRAGQQGLVEFEAWAQTEYSYTQLKTIFSVVASAQETAMRPSERPSPMEVILPAEEIADSSFWEFGAVPDLKARGYLYVDIEGDLVHPDQYEQLRLQGIDVWSQELSEPVLTSLLVPDEQEHAWQETCQYVGGEEVRAYLALEQPYLCTPRELAPECPLSEPLVCDLRRLEAILDPTYCQVRPLVIPLTGRVVIGVFCEQDQQQWILRGPEDVQAFLDACASQEESDEQA